MSEHTPIGEIARQIKANKEAFPGRMARAEKLFELLHQNGDIREALATKDGLSRDKVTTELGSEPRVDRPTTVETKPDWVYSDDGCEMVELVINLLPRSSEPWRLSGIRTIEVHQELFRNEVGCADQDAVEKIFKDWFPTYKVDVQSVYDDKINKELYVCRLTRTIDAEQLAQSHPVILDTLEQMVNEAQAAFEPQVPARSSLAYASTYPSRNRIA